MPNLPDDRPVGEIGSFSSSSDNNIPISPTLGTSVRF
jgi:hypothetical protein